MRHVLVSALLFILIGPAIGALFVNIHNAWPFSGPLSDYFNGSMLLIYLMSLFFGYVIGAIPAAITGAAYAAIIRKLFDECRPTLVASSLIAAATGFVATLLSTAILSDESLDVVGLSCIGALSSVVCSWVARRAGVGPNNSFKPTPLRGAA